MKRIFVFMLFTSFNNCFAQQLASTYTQADSSKQVKPFNSKSTFLKSLIVPTSLITCAYITVKTKALKRVDKNTQHEIREDYPTFITKIDNYLQYAPAFTVYGLNAIGIKGKNNFRDRSIIYGLSTVISAATVISIKRLTKIERPDGTGSNSFPSGHTTTAFAAAEFLRQEYKDISPWYGIAGYAAASATGVLRLYNNKHWVSDVVAGAGFGIISTKVAYWIYPKIKRKVFKNKNANAMLLPYYQSGGGGLAFVYNFKK